MKQKELLDQVLKGNPVMVVEYRASEPEVVRFRNKETGSQEEIKKLTHTVEAGNTSFKVSERVNGDFHPENYQSPFKKGTICVLHIESYSRDKGFNRVASGRLEALEA